VNYCLNRAQGRRKSLSAARFPIAATGSCANGFKLSCILLHIIGQSIATFHDLLNSAVALRRVFLWLISILLLLGVVDGMCAIFLKFVLASRAHFLIWNPDFDGARKAWSAAAGNWDDELGWPSPRDAVTPPRDRTGAKYNSDFPQPRHACASAYGDSFVWGDDVPLADGWIDNFAQAGLPCINYGVPHGTDKLPALCATQDEAVTLLGIFPENIMRNVNQYRGFIGFDLSPVGLKGRLSSTVKVASNGFTGTDRQNGFLNLLRDLRVLPHEYLLPDSRDGPVTLRFPYALALARVALMPRLRVRITDRPSWADFYRADHASGALALTTAMVEAFANEAEHRGKRLLVVMLPSAKSSFRQLGAKIGGRTMPPSCRALAARQIEVFDPEPALLAALRQRSLCELYAANCAGHFCVVRVVLSRKWSWLWLQAAWFSQMIVTARHSRIQR
jgi:hypothetical protein